MKNANQAPGLLRGRFLGFLFMLVTYCPLLLMPGWARGQTKTYATVTPSSGKDNVGLGGTGGVDDAPNAGLVDNSFATINSTRAIGGLLGADGWLQLKFPSNLQPTDWIYVRYSDISQSGLTLGLGSLLGAPGNLINATLYSGATSSSNGTALASTPTVKFVTDVGGITLLAIQAPSNTQVFNSVRIRLTFGGSLNINIASGRSINIYNAYSLSDVEPCTPVLFAGNGENSGIAVDLGGLLGSSGQIVENPSYAIDDNTSNYSALKSSLLSVAGSFSQSFYFPASSEADSKLKVRLQLSQAVADVGLLGGFYIRAFNGNNPTPVLNQTFQSGLINGLDLLGVLNTGGIATVSFDIAGVYDRVEIGVSNTVGINIGADLRIYGVTRTSASCPEPPPTANPLFDPRCANTTIVSSVNADDPQFAVDGNFDSYATIRSDAGILVGLGSRAGHLEVNFPAVVPVGKTTYIRIDYDEDILKALLAGSLGDVVGGLVNGLVLGDHFFEVQLKNDVTETLNTSSDDLFASSNGQVRIVQDKAGRYYIAIKANQPFTNIRITDRTASAVGLLAADKYLNVYSVCYDASDAICDQAFSTSYEGSGITLGLLQLGNTGVENPERAIDDDADTFSEINLGVLSVAGSMSQYVHFNSLSDPKSVFKIKLAVAASETLNVDLLGAYEIIAYNGNTEVYRRSLGGGLLNGTDVLALLGGGQPGTLTFAPGKSFDRIEIRVNGLLGASAFESAVEVYDVKRFGPTGSGCEDPDFTVPSPTPTPFENPSCEAVVVAWENADYAYLAADGNNESFATLTASSGTLLGMGAYSGFLEYEFPATIPANKTTYIRIDMDGNLLPRLLSGTLGTLVDAAGGLLLGDHYFSVEAKTAHTGGTTVLTGSSQGAFANINGGDLRIVQDNLGRYYIAVTPNADYKNIRITEHFPALVGLTQDVASMRIFEACMEMGTDNCLPAQFTSFDQSGLSLGTLNGAGVTNPDHAISVNSSDYSEISTGTLAVAAEVTQRIYFNKLSAAGDTLKVRLQLDPSTLASVDLLGRYRIVTYNGSDVAETFTLQQGVINDLNLLNLFLSGGIQTLTYPITLPYDRVDIVVGSTVNVALTPSVRLYEVKRIGAGCPTTTTPSPFENPTCITTVIGASNVDDIDNLFDNDFDSYATLNSGAGGLLGLGNQYEGFVELGFGEKIPANKTAYVRIDFDAALLDNLLGGSIGGTLANVVNGLTLGDHYFSVQAKDGTTVVLQGGSNNNFGGNNDRLRIVQDNVGRYYIAITPSVEYDAIRITDHTNSLLDLLAQPNAMHVYGVCVDNPLTDCQPVFTTSYDASGLALTALGLAGSGVENADHAINANTTDYSEISLGTVAVGTAVKQIFDFRKKALPGEIINLKLQYGSGALDANVIGALEIIAYNGVTPVKTLDVQSGLINGLNVLDVLNNGTVGVIPFAPGVEFDRISVGLKGIVGVSVLPALRVYAVEKDCDTPMFKTWKSYKETTSGNAVASVKGSEEIEYTIHIANTGAVALTNYRVVDTIPEFTTYVAGSGGTFAGDSVVFVIPTIAVGDVSTVSFRVKVNADLTGASVISNVAFVKENENVPGKGTVPPADPTDPTAGPNESVPPGTTTDIPVNPVSNLISWKAYKVNGDATITSVSGGEEVEYAIYVRNTGNQVLNNLAINDILPAGVTYKEGGTFAGGAVSFTVSTLAVGAEVGPFLFKVDVNTNLTGITVIKNIATVTSDEVTTPKASFPPVDNTDPSDPDDTGETGTSIDVAPMVSLVAWKAYTVDGDATITSVSGGEEVRYTIYVKNNGNQNATEVMITDAIPVGMEYVANSGGTIAAEVVSFGPLTIPSGQVRSVEFRAVVKENLTGLTEITNIAIAKRDASDTGVLSHPPLDNTDPETSGPNTSETGTTLDVEPTTLVSIGIVGVSNNPDSPSKAEEGNTITYTITLTNDGNIDLNNVIVTNPLPNNTTYVTNSANNGGSLNGSSVEFTNISLAVGETKTFTYEVTVDPVPMGVTSISTTATVSYPHEDSGEPNKTASATAVLQTNCTTVVAADILLQQFGTSICAGSSTHINILPSATSPLTNAVYYLYNNPALTGIPITFGENQAVNLSPAITTTYYIVLTADGVCFTGTPREFTIEVRSTPEKPTISPEATELCSGETITLEASVSADSYLWYHNGNLINGQEGQVLTIANATIANSGEYTVVARNGTDVDDYCESDESDDVVITVHPRATAGDIAVTGNTLVCGGTGVTLVASTSLTVANPVFKWYDSPTATTPIFTGATLNMVPNETTTYYVALSGDALCENLSTDRYQVDVTVNPAPVVVFNAASSYTIQINESVDVPTYMTEPNVTYQWKDQNGADFSGTSFGPFASPGTYVYTLIATNAISGCQTAANVTIQVFNPGECPPVYTRVYANDASQYEVSKLVLVDLGSVTNPSQAADQNVATFSTLTEVANVLGLLGQTYQNIKWVGAPIPAATPVTVKLGKTLTVAQLAGGIHVQAINAAGNPIGVVQSVDTDLLNIVAGENIFDFTFTPTDGSGEPIAYSGVRVSLSALATIAQSVNLYEAYYHNPGTPDCNQLNGVVDVLHGIERPIGGVGALNGLVNVIDAMNAVDGNEATVAVMNNGIGVNAYTRLEVLYNTPAFVGDTLTIRVGKPSSLLNVGLLESFTIQPYLGNTAVGTPIHNDNNLLKITLLAGGEQADVQFIASAPYDRVKILYGGVASVLDQLQVHEITRTIPAVVAGVNGDNKFEICEGGDVSIPTPDNCTTYIIYDAVSGGAVVDITTLAAGTYTLYVQTVRFGTCATGNRTPIEVTVNGLPVAPVIANTTVCQTPVSTMVSYDVVALANHTLVYYTDATTTTPLAAVPTVDSQVSGVTTVYVAQINTTTGCESARVSVSIVVNRTATAADITVSDATICAGDSFTLTASSSTVSNPVFRFYSDATLTTEITNLTVSPAEGTHTYYVTVSGDAVCANSVGNAAVITLKVNRNATAADIAVSDATICAGDSFTLTASSSTVSNPVFRFYSNATLTTEITNLTISPAVGTHTYYVTVSGDGVCANKAGYAAMIALTVNRNATATDITVSDATICAGDGFTLSASSSTVPNPVFRFYSEATLTTEITNLTVSPAVGTHTYYVTVSGDGVCANKTGYAAMLTLKVNGTATAADITVSDATICAGESFTLSASSTTVSNPVFRFYSDVALTTEITNLTVSPTAGTHTYYVTVSGDGVCANKAGDAAVMTLTVNRTATAADITVSDATICAGESFILNAGSSTVSNPVFRFYSDAALTTEITNLTVSPAVGTHTYYVTVSGDGACANKAGDAAMMTLTVNRTATAADITISNATVCAGESFILTASSSTVSNPVFRFYSDAALTTEITNLTVSPTVGTHTYYVTVSGDGVCANKAGDAAMMTLTVNRTATAADITVSNATVCAEESFTLTASSGTVSNPVFRFYSDAALTTEITNLAVSPGVGEHMYYVTVSGDGVCANKAGDAAVITVETVYCHSVISVTKVADQNRVKAGETTTFTVTLKNEGPADIAAGKELSLLERPSTGLSITGYTINSGNATIVANGNTAKITANTLIPIGGAVVVKIAAKVDADAPATITNGVTVWGPDKPTTDTPDDEDDTPPIPVDRESKLSIEKVADQSRVKAGENTTFTLTVTNNGPSTIDIGKTIRLTERPGAGVTIDKYEMVSTNATISGTGNSATLTTTAKIATGQTMVVKVTAKVDADAPSTITNGITVWGPDKPTTDTPDDEDDTPPIPVDRDYRMTIEKVADQARVKAGEMTTFTVTITNNGPSVMEIGKNIKLTERPGAGVRIDKYEIIGSNATISGTGNKATVTTTAKLLVGGTIVVKVTAKVDDEAPATITNGISVWRPDKPDTEDPDDEDDTPEIPVDYPLIAAVDDVAETKTAIPVVIDVLENDVVTKWDIDRSSIEIVASPSGATITVNTDGTVTYVSSRDLVGEDIFTYRVKDIKGRWSNIATVRVLVASNDLDIPNIITPNGDGKNDVFRIKGIELYDKVTLTIVNRWGNEVYRSNSYANDWGGLGLSEGTYFYVLELMKADKKETHKGWVTIKSN